MNKVNINLKDAVRDKLNTFSKYETEFTLSDITNRIRGDVHQDIYNIKEYDSFNGYINLEHKEVVSEFKELVSNGEYEMDYLKSDTDLVKSFKCKRIYG